MASSVEHTSMHIYLKTVTGAFIDWKVSINERIGDIKRKILPKEDNSTDKHSLVFDGKQLKDDRTLSDYNIHDGFTVLLVPEKWVSSTIKHYWS